MEGGARESSVSAEAARQGDRREKSGAGAAGPCGLMPGSVGKSAQEGVPKLLATAATASLVLFEKEEE